MFSARTLFYVEAVAKAITISLFLLTHLSIVVAFIKTRLLLIMTLLLTMVRNMGRSVEEAIISSTGNILEETSQECGPVDI